MKTLSLFTLLISFNSFAELSRSPAVLPSTCNVDTPTTFIEMVNGKEVVREKPIAQVKQEQCAEVKKCMYSAEEEEMPALKKLEDLACNNSVTPVNTRVPSLEIDNKSFDGRRVGKPDSQEISPSTPAPTAVGK